MAIAGAKPSAQNASGSIGMEVSLGALMLVAAGIIASDVNLKTPRGVRLQSEAFGAMLKVMAKADRAAGDSGEPRLLDLIGAGVAPSKNTGAVN